MKKTDILDVNNLVKEDILTETTKFTNNLHDLNLNTVDRADDSKALSHAPSF